jgi:prepilin signal peptidase PulO-like enzyme (type II secretory pathway)
VFISPRYVIIEAATALRVGGLFACYYIFHVRAGAGEFVESAPMFAAHAALLCGLLACSIVDAEHFQIPLEVMWVCTAAGLVAATARPHPFLEAVSAPTIGVGLAAVLGLLVSFVLLRRGFIQPSFIDAEDAPPSPPAPSGRAKAQAAPAERAPAGGSAKPQAAAREETRTRQKDEKLPPRPLGLRTIVHIVVGTITAALLAYVPGGGSKEEDTRNVAFSTAHGIRPRKEILWEVVFLVPPLFCAGMASLVLRHVPSAADAWGRLFDPAVHPLTAPHLTGLGSAIFGYLIGGLWVWATRILGTLAFNKEAMGMGDVHILAAIGAVFGWIVPSLTFFVSPFIGLGWALYVWIGRKQGVIAYGPLLATGCLAVMLFYDPLYARVLLLLHPVP